MKTIKQTYHIKAPVEKVWEALVNSKEIEGWGAVPAKIDDEADDITEGWKRYYLGEIKKLLKK